MESGDTKAGSTEGPLEQPRKQDAPISAAAPLPAEAAEDAPDPDEDDLDDLDGTALSQLPHGADSLHFKAC